MFSFLPSLASDLGAACAPKSVVGETLLMPTVDNVKTTKAALTVVNHLLNVYVVLKIWQ